MEETAVNVKDMSVIEILKKNIDENQLVKDLAEKYLVEKIADLKAKVESGEIDPIKGTDLDKTALLGAIAAVEKLLGL